MPQRDHWYVRRVHGDGIIAVLLEYILPQQQVAGILNLSNRVVAPSDGYNNLILPAAGNGEMYVAGCGPHCVPVEYWNVPSPSG